MAQNGNVGNDAVFFQPIAAATPGLDWSRVAQEAGCGSPNRVLTHPFEPLDACSSVPQIHNPQVRPAELHPAIVSRPEKVTTPEKVAPDYLVNDTLYPFLRNTSYGASLVLSSELSQAPFKLSNLGFLLFAEVADNLVDDHYFKDVKRGKISTFIDVASNAVMFTPEPGSLKATELFALHVLGKEIEKHYS
jgi:hypothetical protein